HFNTAGNSDYTLSAKKIIITRPAGATTVPAPIQWVGTFGQINFFGNNAGGNTMEVTASSNTTFSLDGGSGSGDTLTYAVGTGSDAVDEGGLIVANGVNPVCYYDFSKILLFQNNGGAASAAIAGLPGSGHSPEGTAVTVQGISAGLLSPSYSWQV